LSAILKALRKIEKASSGEDQAPSFSKNLDPKKVIHRRARKALFLRRLVSVLVPFLILASVVVLVFTLKSFLPGSTVFLSPVSRVHGEEEKDTKLRAQEQKRESHQEPEKIPKERTDPRIRAAMESSPGSSSLKARSSAPGENSEAHAAYRGGERPSIPTEPRLQDKPTPSLELQAIVWSDDPASCFAVINGRIVRPGGMVDGVSVVEIDKETVSLKLGEKTWTLRMLEGD
jgi:hypothetical protein